MSERTGGAPGAGAAIGLVLSLAVIALLGFAAYRAVDGDAPGKWIYVGVAAGLVLLHAVAFGAGIKLITRGVASVTYLFAAVAVALLWLGVERDAVPLAFGVSLEAAVPIGLAVLVSLGAIALPAMPSSNPGRVIGGVLALAVVAPWWMGVIGGDGAEAILVGHGQFWETWPRLAQPALIGGGVALLVLVLAGIAILGGRKHPDQRVLALCALVIPGLAGALMVAYAMAGGAGPGSAATDAGSGADAGVPPPHVKLREVPDAAPAVEPGAPTPKTDYDCSGVIFPDRDISASRDRFTPGGWREAALAVLAKRYPDAAWLVGTLKDPKNFDVWLTGQTDSWRSMILALGTGVHESSHIADIALGRGRRHSYILGEGDVLEIKTPRTFNRSEIADTLPAEVRELSYTETYLAGKSGAQGFDMVLEELNAYTYSLFVAIATADQIPKGTSTSNRDGLLVLMFYTEAFLELARESKPKTYAAITRDPQLVAAVIKLYDRATCALGLSKGIPGLGINDAMLQKHVFGAEKLGEIDRLRALPR